MVKIWAGPFLLEFMLEDYLPVVLLHISLALIIYKYFVRCILKNRKDVYYPEFGNYYYFIIFTPALNIPALIWPAIVIMNLINDIFIVKKK